MKLLNIDKNAKTIKGQKKGYLTAVMYLAPAKSSGREVCPMRSKGCTEACLNTAGRGAFSNVQEARINRTNLFFDNRKAFMFQLEKEIDAFLRKAKRENKTPTVRLNGTSDIPWEKISFEDRLGKKWKNVMEKYSDIQFYDYTKRPNRKNLPTNYHLTFSLAEDNDENAKKALKNNINVAIVFKEVPKKYWSLPVVDGDETDLRFLDGKKKIIGLKAKGKAKKDTSGFVRIIEKPFVKK